jgi:hypothetical protein
VQAAEIVRAAGAGQFRTDPDPLDAHLPQQFLAALAREADDPQLVRLDPMAGLASAVRLYIECDLSLPVAEVRPPAELVVLTSTFAAAHPVPGLAIGGSPLTGIAISVPRIRPDIDTLGGKIGDDPATEASNVVHTDTLETADLLSRQRRTAYLDRAVGPVVERPVQERGYLIVGEARILDARHVGKKQPPIRVQEQLVDPGETRHTPDFRAAPIQAMTARAAQQVKCPRGVAAGEGVSG